MEIKNLPKRDSSMRFWPLIFFINRPHIPHSYPKFFSTSVSNLWRYSNSEVFSLGQAQGQGHGQGQRQRHGQGQK
jgi:hypothetical protein